MAQQLSPWLEGAYGWSFGESGWNSGMDQNLLKFSFMFDRNVDGIVDALPSPMNGKAYFLNTDNRLYFAVGTAWYSSPTPKWSIVTLRTNGETYQFNGASLVKIPAPTEVSSRLVKIEAEIATLGTAAYEDVGYFATQAGLDLTAAQANNYTDSSLLPLSTKLSKYVSPFDYGAVGNFITDDTAAVAAAIAAAKSQRKPLLLDGDFAVTQAVIDSANGLTIISAGTLTGLGGGAYEAVLVIKNSADVTHTGRLVISGSYNTGYSAGAALYTDNGTQCSTLELHGISFAGCQRTWAIGRESEPDALISEITISGGYAYGCPGGPVVVGTQTVVNFVSPQLITGINGGSGTWLTLDRICLTNKGASITITGGEALIVDVSTGLLFDMQPVGGSSIGNQYGSLYIQGTTIEAASQLCQFRNPSAVTGLASGRGILWMSGCPGFHSQDTAPFIQASDDFTGRIVIEPNNISCPLDRTQPNIGVGAALCDIWVKDNSFGRGFIAGDSGVQGGKLHRTYRDILRAANSNNQSFTANVQSTIVWTAAEQGVDLTRDSARYNITTGKFTVGPEGLKDASMFIKIRLSSLSASANFAVYANDTFLTGSPQYGGDGLTGIHQCSIPLGNLSAGTVLDIRLTATATCTMNFGVFETMIISGRTM